MKSGLFLFLLTSLLAVFSGCVSQSTFDALQMQHDNLQKELEQSRQSNTDCQNSLAQTRTQVANLEQERKNADEKMAGMLKDKDKMAASIEDLRLAMSEMANRKAEADKRIEEFQNLVKRFQKLIDAGRLKVKILKGRMVVELATDVLFGSGSANLSREGKTAIQEVTQVLNDIPDRQFQIEGHTDDVGAESSNWDLASNRALTVVKTMVEAGLPPNRISAASYGENQPIVTNDSRENRQQNRRIEIVVVPDRSTLPGFQELEHLKK